MLSVLISTYNYNAVKLVTALHKQLLQENILFEILCYDNGSEGEANKDNEVINQFSNTTFKALDKNKGRSKLRNLLAQDAKYDWLLFLDADVFPVTDFFISDYLHLINKSDLDVAYGGLKYQTKPSNDKLLRWIYGKSREEIDLIVREKNPQRFFTSANFLINNKIFHRFKFDETLVDYGHEDTLLALELTKNNIQIKQIDNPVYHLGIDNSEVFLKKTKESVRNLYKLSSQNKIKMKDSKILKTFDQIRKFRMIPIIKVIYFNFSKYMESNLLSGKPSLLIFDFYKLGYLCSLEE